MKSAITLLFVCVIGHYTYAQKVDGKAVPQTVWKAFKMKYPTVNSVKWEKEKENYEAEFKENNKEISVLFDAKGTLLEIETEISKTSLPKVVSEAIDKEYAGYKIEEAEKVEANGVTTYEVEVEKKEKTIELVYDSNGKLISSKEEESKEKD